MKDNNNMHGVLTRGGYVDIAFTERGAKNFATRHGYKEVYRRSPIGDFTVILVATHNGKRWVKS